MIRTPRRSSPRFASLALLGALTIASACKGDDPAAKAGDKPATKTGEAPSDVKPVVPTGPVANPVDSPAITDVGEVVATMQIPSGTAMSDLMSIVDGIQPGASAMLKLQLPGMIESALGFDLAKTAKLDAPISIVVLDPTAHTVPLALLVTPKDEAALTAAATKAGHAVEIQNGLALIGPEGVVTAAKAFSFEHLTRYPDHTELVIYPQRLMTSYADVINGSLAAMNDSLGGQAGGEAMAKMMRGYVDGIIAIGGQTDRLVISVASAPGTSDMLLRAYPTVGSMFSQFIEAQVATDHALLSKLPGDSGVVLFSGDLRAGSTRDAIIEFSSTLMGPMYGGLPPEEWKKLLAPWLDNLDGRYAMTMNMTVDPSNPMSMEMRALMGATDSATLRTGWRAMLAQMASAPATEMLGMSVTAKHEVKVLEHDGVEVDLYESTIDTSKMPAAQAAALEQGGGGNQKMHLATFDDYAVMATADADGKAIAELIDAARGKGQGVALSPMLTQAIAASTARGDSMLMYFDLNKMFEKADPKPPQIPFKAMAMSYGKQDGALSMRLSMLK